MKLNLSRPFVRFAACLALVVALVPSVSTAQTDGWQPGPGATQGDTIQGFVDQPANGSSVPGSGSLTLSGWVVDTTAQGWAGIDSVQIYLGAMNSGTMLAPAVVAQPRPDVAAALGNPAWAPSGFVATVQGSAVPAGNQMLFVYVHTPAKGWWYRQVSVLGGGVATALAVTAGALLVITVTQPTENENVSATGSAMFGIEGTATDPAYGPSAIDSVDIWLNGERNSGGGTELGNVVPDSGGNWSLQFEPTKFSDIHSNLYIYAHSSKTGETIEFIRGFDIVG